MKWGHKPLRSHHLEINAGLESVMGNIHLTCLEKGLSVSGTDCLWRFHWCKSLCPCRVGFQQSKWRGPQGKPYPTISCFPHVTWGSSNTSGLQAHAPAPVCPWTILWGLQYNRKHQLWVSHKWAAARNGNRSNPSPESSFKTVDCWFAWCWGPNPRPCACWVIAPFPAVHDQPPNSFLHLRNHHFYPQGWVRTSEANKTRQKIKNKKKIPKNYVEKYVYVII